MKRQQSGAELIQFPGALAEPTVSFDRAGVLSEQFQTPFLVLSPSRVTQSVETLREHLPGVELYYAMKSNPDLDLLHLLAPLVDGIDVASYGEVRIARSAGVEPSRMINSNPVKREPDLLACVREGLRWYVFDNVGEIPKMAACAPDANVLLRVAISNPNCVVNLAAKFGAQPNEVLPLLVEAREAGLNVRGLAFHVGSQSKDPSVYLTALRVVRSLFDQAASLGFHFDTLDIGGGFPVPYRTAVPDLADFCRVVFSGLLELFPEGVRVLAEPGRCISGPAMTLVVQVVGKSLRGGVPWYFIDDGVYGAFSGKFFDNCDYRLLSDRRGPARQCVVAGPSCDSIDIVSNDQWLPDLSVGDLLLVPGMGAYTRASATEFNGFAPPATVLEAS